MHRKYYIEIKNVYNNINVAINIDGALRERGGNRHRSVLLLPSLSSWVV